MTRAGRIDPRAPAIALAELVEQDGQEAPRVVYREFQEYNEEHFEGRLQQSMLLITHPASPRTLGDYVPKDVHGIPSRIRIAPRCATIGLRYVVDVLLHEMVHAWQHEVLGDLETGYEGHGPLFAKQCNAIGSKMGLAEVAPKGRGGKPNAAHWPLCVRPPGYYGTNDPREPSPPPEESDGKQPAQPTAKAAARIEGLDRDDVAFLRVLGAATGEEVATTIRRLAVEEGRRLVQAGGEVGAAVQKALDLYQRSR